MGFNTRAWAKRKISMADGNLESASDHLAEVRDTYEKEHEDIARYANAIMEGIQGIRNALKDLGGRF